DLTLTPYERGVEYVDRHVGHLLAELGRQDRLRGMVIAVAADHGEDLGRRLREGHGAYLFDDATRVPLLIWGAACAPQVLPEPVSTLRLGGTLGALAGVSVPGHDLLPGGTDPPLPVVVEEASVDTLGFKRAVILGSHKLIVDERNGGRMLFDLADDPGENRDVYDARPTLARELEASYQAWLDHPASR
ncbi:MAG TPA: sulfatase-like hydrolase/transferase, partial [Polyangiaceae bacterium]